MAKRSWYLVGYDVRDDKRLRRVATVVEGYGVRIQYSLFQCRLSDQQAAQLKWELSKIMAVEDSLLIAGLCERCVQALRTESVAVELPEEPDPWEIV
jgi:CRISPR-associated protein Cas2